MSAEALIERMSRALEGLQALPWGVHAAVALAMAAGLVLWLVGQKMLKPMVVVLAAAIGACAGFFAVTASAWGASLSVWHGLGLGAIAGGLVGLLLYRSAMAVGFGLVMGALAPLVAAAILEARPLDAAGPPGRGSDQAAERSRTWPSLSRLGSPPQQSETSHRRVLSGGMDGVSVREALELAREAGVTRADLDRVLPVGLPVEWDRIVGSSGSVDRSGAKVPEAIRPAVDATRGFLRAASERATDKWQEVPARHQAVIAGAAAVGLAGGIVLGLAAPAWTASTLTAMLGSGIWLACFAWLSNAMSAPWRGALDRGPSGWLAIWGAAAVVGMLVQWTGVLKRRRKKPAAAQA